MLSDRHTMLSFDSFTSDIIPIDNGIVQGETASMILYLIYRHGLINILQGPHEDGGAYVNDTFIAIANTFNECDNMLNNMLNKQSVWSSLHNSVAEITKFQCLHLTSHKNIERADFIHTQTHQHIACIPLVHLLEVHIDQELHWHSHVQHAI